jgi:hypothetical protein
MVERFSLTDFFAHHFFRLADGEFIEIRAFPKDAPPSRSWHPDALSAARAALAYPAEVPVYFSVNARQNSGGEKKHVTKVRTLHADLDFKCFADGRDGALAAINAFPLPPTVVVNSGNGFHAYWYLREPIDPDLSIEALMKRLYLRLGATAIKPLDGVHDLSRIMRAPGTFNTKTTPAKLAQVRHAEYEAVYTLADFERLLPAPAEPVRPAWSPPSGTAGRPAYGDISSIAEMREIMRHIPPTGDYTADWLRILAAVHSVYPGHEGIAICEEWSPGKPGEIARKFASFKRDGRADDATSVATLIYTAKQYGYQPPAPRAGAAAKFAIPEPAADGDVRDVLQMAEALDTAQRRIAELEEQGAAKDRRIAWLEADNASLREELEARKLAAAHTDQTIGGAIFDIAGELVAARQRGDVLNEDGKQLVRVEYKRAATHGIRSAQTNSKAVHKLKDSGHVPVMLRPVRIETENYVGEVEAAYIEIPEEHCTTPAKAALFLLPPPAPKKHGGKRRKIDLPDFGEEVQGPIEVKTEKKRIYRAVADERVLKVEPLETHTEYCDEDGYQLTTEEVNTFRESIGLKIKVPSYRPQVVPKQMALSEADRQLLSRDQFDNWLDEEPPPPTPLRGKGCLQPGCELPPVEHGFCSRHVGMLSLMGAG